MQLRPSPGDALRVETQLPKMRLNLRLIGMLEGEAVLVTAPARHITPLTEGSPLQVRMLMGNRLCHFSSRLQRVQTQPFGHWILSWPDKIELSPLRAHSRVPVNLAVRIEREELEGMSQMAWCSDLSLQGAAIDAGHPLARPGERLFITARISVAGIDHMLLLPARVKNLVTLEQQSPRLFRHGVEFFDLEEEIRLVLAGFVYQQWLIETGYLDASEKV